MKSKQEIIKSLESSSLLDKNSKFEYSDILFNIAKNQYIKYSQTVRPKTNTLSKSQQKKQVQVNQLKVNANNKLVNIIYVYYKTKTNLTPLEIYRRMDISAKDSLYTAINNDKKGVARNSILKQIYAIKDNVLRKNVLNLFNTKLSQAANPVIETIPISKQTTKPETKVDPVQDKGDYSQVYSKFYEIYNNAIRDLQYTKNINEAQKILDRSQTEMQQFETYVKGISTIPNAKPHEVLNLTSSIAPLIKQKVKTDKGWDLK